MNKSKYVINQFFWFVILIVKIVIFSFIGGLALHGYVGMQFPLGKTIPALSGLIGVKIEIIVFIISTILNSLFFVCIEHFKKSPEINS